MAGSCEHGNETSNIINCGEFLDQLSDYQFLKGSVPESELVNNTVENYAGIATC
jgi:hypothetical protein